MTVKKFTNLLIQMLLSASLVILSRLQTMIQLQSCNVVSSLLLFQAVCVLILPGSLLLQRTVKESDLVRLSFSHRCDNCLGFFGAVVRFEILTCHLQISFLPAPTQVYLLLDKVLILLNGGTPLSSSFSGQFST